MAQRSINDFFSRIVKGNEAELTEECNRSLYLPFVDHLNNEIDEQLVKPLPGFQAQLLIPGEKTLIMLCYHIKL